MKLKVSLISSVKTENLKNFYCFLLDRLLREVPMIIMSDSDHEPVQQR